ncbi:MAG: hypothetical protein FWC41_08165 [Firmicutes bacterium]|nr:hypothetical protein [Bacillota bacterium]
MFKEIFNRKLMILLSICLIATLTIGILETVHAKDITIGPNTPGGLKKAIETVNTSDTIFLQNGVYKGESNTNIFSNKSVKIYGLGNNVILDGQGKNQILTILNGGASIKNLKFINGYS